MVNGEGSQVNALSQAAIGRALGLSPPAITKLKGQGMPVNTVEAAQAWRLARQNIAARKPLPFDSPLAAVVPMVHAPGERADDESHDQARARRERAEADLAELKLAELRGELVRATAVRAAIARQAAGLREALLQMPSRLVPILAADPDPGRMDMALRAEIVSALQQITGAT